MNLFFSDVFVSICVQCAQIRVVLLHSKNP